MFRKKEPYFNKIVMTNITDRTASRFLGKQAGASDFYNPDLPVAVPREENRSYYNLLKDTLPFEGWDVWHAYEFSAMTESGLPVTRVLKLRYNCDNDFIVESKSLKLYLNSFNMTKLGSSTEECLALCKARIEKDLSETLKTSVQVAFLDNNVPRLEIFSQFQNVMDFVAENAVCIEKFKEAPEVLAAEETDCVKEYYLKFDSLRSNCRVTHQPDFGDAFIYYKSKKHIVESSLVKYLVSFRSEFHFHEECCEMIFKRLFDLLVSGDELFVAALYTRRGGIDICPVRRSRNCSIDADMALIDVTKFARCGIKQ